MVQNGSIILRFLAVHTKFFLFCLSYSDAAELPLNPVNPSTSDLEQDIVSVAFMKFCMIISAIARNSHAEVLSRKGMLKICNNFKGEHPCRNVISIKFLKHK